MATKELQIADFCNGDDMSEQKKMISETQKVVDGDKRCVCVRER